MKKAFHLLAIMSVLCLFTVGMTSCSEKGKALRNLEQLAEEVQENGDNYTIGEWKEVLHQYQAINGVIEHHYMDYTQKERNRIMCARSDIKQAAIDSFVQKLDLLPDAIKQTLLNWLNTLFGSLASGQSANAEAQEAAN